MEPTDEEKARRFHEAAVRDANRYIAIMAALVKTPQENPKTEFTDSDDEDILTPEERAILEDFNDRPTSDELFAKVGQESLDLLASRNSLNNNK